MLMLCQVPVLPRGYGSPRAGAKEAGEFRHAKCMDDYGCDMHTCVNINIYIYT